MSFQMFLSSIRQKIPRPLSQANIKPNFNLWNCILLLQDGSPGEAWESSKQS